MTEPSYTLAEIRANLVILSDIAARVERGISTVSNWVYRYAGTADPFPEAIICPLPAGGGDHNRGRRPIYWWPQVEAWLERNQLPRTGHGRAREAADGR